METVQSLEPKIRAILTAPGTDLSTISAKRVRKQLLEDGSAPSAFIRENKHDVDEFIADVFRRVSQEVGGPGADDGEDEYEGDDVGDKRKREYDDEEVREEEVQEEDEEEEARPKKKTKASKAEISDAEYARQLSNELNGRSRASRSGTSSTSSRGKGKGGANGAKRGRKVKSAETVDSADEGEAPKKKRGGGFKKEYVLSEPLSAVLGAEKMARPQVVKELWNYIKANSMQNPDNKREIMCDAKFRAVFNVEKIDMFKMNKVLGNHLHEPEA